MDIVKNIVEIRKEKGKNQEILADALNVDVSAISNIEKGKRELKVSELAKIAKALEVDVVYLITYPEVYVSPKKSNTTRVVVELEISNDEFVQMGLKKKILETFK